MAPPTATTPRRRPSGDPQRQRQAAARQRAQQPARQRVEAAGRAAPPRGPAAPDRSRFAPRPGRIDRRQRLLMAGVLMVLMAFSLRLVYLQGFIGDELAAEALGIRLDTQVLPAQRGDIVDSDGVVLAGSVERYTIFVDQNMMAEWAPNAEGDTEYSGPMGVAELLAPVLGLSEAELGPLLIGESQYKVIAKEVTPQVRLQVLDLGIKGVYSERSEDRLYPAGTTAGNILGWVNAEGDGASGIELAYDQVLAGTDGTQTLEVARGRVIPTGEQEVTPAVPGSTVHLTIDRDLQYQTQTALDDAVSRHGADRGMAVILDTRTGEVLTLADSGSVDPNDPGATAAENRGSRAISDVFEPGSTAKMITMAAAIETGLATPYTQFTAPYQYMTSNGQVFTDSHEHPTLQLTLNGILAESSNTGTVKIGELIPRQVRYDYLAKFGFGSRTGLGLPGESGGILNPVDSWDGRSQYAVLFGQAVSVTALQATRVMAIIANGGVAEPVTIVSGTTDPDGQFTPTETEEPVQVVSAETAQQVLTMLESAVDDGTGVTAQIEGYRVAGKTGTAQAADGQGGMTNIVASFVGVAPADDPRFAVGVFLFNPRTSIYGAVVAAPVFQEVMSFALQHYAVPPSDTPAELYPLTW